MRGLMILQGSSLQVNNVIIPSIIGSPSSDSTYRQKVQILNDEKYKIQNEAAQYTEVSTLVLYPIVTNHCTL